MCKHINWHLCKMFISFFTFSSRRKICEYAASVCFVIHNIFTSKKILILVNLRVITLHHQKRVWTFFVEVVATAFTLLWYYFHVCFGPVAVIFLGVMENECGNNVRDSWLLKVMIAFTVWDFLNVIWIVILSSEKRGECLVPVWI